MVGWEKANRDHLRYLWLDGKDTAYTWCLGHWDKLRCKSQHSAPLHRLLPRIISSGNRFFLEAGCMLSISRAPGGVGCAESQDLRSM